MIFSKILFLFLAFFLFTSNFQKGHALDSSYQTSLQSRKGLHQVTEFSSNSLFQYYYHTAMEKSKSCGTNLIGYDDFCNGYLSSSLTINDYVDSLASQKLSNLYSSKASMNHNIKKSSSSSLDASYILNGYVYQETPINVFKRDLVYGSGNYESFSSILREGDLICETRTIFWDAGHVAIIVDLSKQRSDSRNFIETIEAVAGGVQYGFLDDDRILRYGVEIYRTVSFSDTFSRVNEFLINQLRKRYNYNYTEQKVSINSTCWYCSELAWAAYHYAEIDIGKKNGVNLDYTRQACWPTTIENSDSTVNVNLVNYFLRVSVEGKNGRTWLIRISNDINQGILIQYNNKMCYRDDANNWTNLQDIRNLYLAANSSSIVEINENWFATTIVCGWCYGNVRYITFASQLDANRYTLVDSHNVIGSN